VKTLYAGPWVGEFGWELMSWNPLVRKKAQDYDRVVVEGPPNSQYLYEFADEYIANPIIPHTSDGYSGENGNPPAFPPYPHDSFTPNWGLHGAPEMRGFEQPFALEPNKEWRCLAPEPVFVADVLCAFRPEKKLRNRMFPGREYPLELCIELIDHLLERGLTIACIGGPDNYLIPGTISLMDVHLETLCAAVSAAKVVIGPSSGPMHLASLCKTPHVLWFAVGNNLLSRARYKDHWNPFKTPHTYMEPALPTPEEIVSAVEPYLV